MMAGTDSRRVCKYSILSFSVFFVGFALYFIQYHDIWITSTHTDISQGNIKQYRFVAKNYDFADGELRMFGYFLNSNSSKALYSSILRVENLPLNMKLLSQSDSKNNTKIISSSQKRLLELNKRFFSIPQNVPGINCSALFAGETDEQNKTKKLMSNPRPAISEISYINMTKNCKTFKRSQRYITNTLTKEEEEFPIAYSIVTFKDVEQTERLLRAIYRPQHAYCIHIDIKSKPDYRQAIQSIANCFDNVFLSSRSVDVQWATFTVLEADLICMEDLWKYKKWKYFINLTGQEFPLRTNYELMRILKIYDGANDLEGTLQRANQDRWTKAGEPPHGIRPVKGSVHIAVNRDFVDYILHNETAIDFLNWTKFTDTPDETFFSSLNHNPQLGIPGSYKGDPETDKIYKPFLTRFKNWGNGVFDWPCEGQRVRLICVFGIGDLPLLSTRPEMFANKFYWDYEPYALDCMEELIYNKTRDEYLHKMTFDTEFYESVDFITNKV